MEKYIIENGIKYELRGEQYYPIFSETNTTEHHIGKYGLLHRDYIKQHKRGIYTTSSLSPLKCAPLSSKSTENPSKILNIFSKKVLTNYFSCDRITRLITGNPSTNKI